MAPPKYDNPAYYVNRNAGWLGFNARVLEEAENGRNPLLERVKFLSITARNLDEFIEIRMAGLLQQVEDGVREASLDGLTPLQQRDLMAPRLHTFVEQQYRCWNLQLRPQLAEQRIRVLDWDDLSRQQRAFAEKLCRRDLDPLLTPVTIDPAHPFPRVQNKALCLAFLLRRKRKNGGVLMGVVTVPRALPRRRPSRSRSTRSRTATRLRPPR